MEHLQTVSGKCMACGGLSGDIVNHHCVTCRMLSELRTQRDELLAACRLIVKAHPLNGNSDCETCVASRAAEAAIARVERAGGKP